MPYFTTIPPHMTLTFAPLKKDELGSFKIVLALSRSLLESPNLGTSYRIYFLCLFISACNWPLVIPYLNTIEMTLDEINYLL
jgi:hypothetical protein